ncbi:diguanylate cyclase [Pseudomonas sp. FW305-130]|nr:diguanylate cyclase [Pseudomonas sp. GW460-5]PNB60916.1 diguanylate cyclase [Pseudomonas sp. FW305-130]
MGAGMPANTGKAGAINRVGFFAGEPAPTGPAQCLRSAPYLWEPRLAMGCAAAPAI